MFSNAYPNNNNNAENDKIYLSGLWINKSRNDEVYLSGQLTPTCKLLAFKNTYKKNDNDPDFKLYIVPVKPRDANPEDDQDVQYDPYQF